MLERLVERGDLSATSAEEGGADARLKSGSAFGLPPLIALMLVAAACGGGNDGGGGEEGGTITVGGEQANDHGGKNVSGGNELDLELDDFYFEPTVLTGTAGETLTLHPENEGSTEHNVSLTDQGIDQDVEDGGKASVTVPSPTRARWCLSARTTRTWGCEGRSRSPSTPTERRLVRIRRAGP